MPKISVKNCRICLKQSDLIDIHLKDDLNLSHFNKLTKIVPDMKLGRKGSRKICLECIDELNVSYSFYEKCLNSLNELGNVSSDLSSELDLSKLEDEDNAPVVSADFTLQIPETPLPESEPENECVSPSPSIEEPNCVEQRPTFLREPYVRFIRTPLIEEPKNVERRTPTIEEPNIEQRPTFIKQPIVRLVRLDLEQLKGSLKGEHSYPKLTIMQPQIETTDNNIDNDQPSVGEIKRCVMCNQEFTAEKLQQHFKTVHAVKKLLEHDSYGTIRRVTGKTTHNFIKELNSRINKRTSLLETSQVIFNQIVKDKTDTVSVMSMETNNSTETNNSKETDNLDGKTVKKKKKYECIYCAKVLDEKVQNTKHLQLHEISISEKKCFRCKYCNAQFSELTRLALHVRIHEKQEIFECTICPKVCTSTKSLRAHMHVHDKVRKSDPGYIPHEKGGFKCLTCGERLASRGSMYCHLARHSEKKPHQCKDCPSAFKTKAGLIQHVSCMHSPTAYACTVCDRTFIYKYALLQHLATHTYENNEPKC